MRSKFTTSNWFIFSLTDSLYTWKEIIIQLVDTTFFIPLYCFSWAELYLCHLCNPTWCITIILNLPNTSTKKTYVKKLYMIIFSSILRRVVLLAQFGNSIEFTCKKYSWNFQESSIFCVFSAKWLSYLQVKSHLVSFFKHCIAHSGLCNNSMYAIHRVLDKTKIHMSTKE